MAPPPGEIAARVERLVIGADFGDDGYTTAARADQPACGLGRRRGRVLELGSGRG